LPDATLRLFGSGHFAKTLIWSASELFLSYFAHIHLGLDARATGLLIFASLLYSGLLDGAAAVTLALKPGREERVPRLQMAGAALTALGSILLFLPVRLPPAQLFAWLLLASILFRTGYTLYDVSQNALVSLLPSDEAEAHRYVKFRTILSFAAKIFVALASFYVIGGHGRANAALMVIASIALLVVASAIPISRHEIRIPDTTPAPDVSRLPLRFLLPILIAASAQVCLLGLVGKFIPFVLEPATGLSMGPSITLATVFSGMIGPFLTPRARMRGGRQTLCVALLAAVSALGAILMLVADRFSSIIFAACLFGVGGGATTALIWNELSAIVRDYARQAGKRTDLLSFALLTAVIKLSVAVSGLVFGLLLDGYEARTSSSILWISGITIAGGILFTLGMTGAVQTMTRRLPLRGPARVS
jgi:Na+/melibiose symporter-like transporter